MERPYIPFKHLAQYGFLALPLAFAGLPLYIHAPDFFTRHLGLNIGVAGSILIAVRIFDAVQDPLFGLFLDKNPHRRREFFLLGALLLTLGMAGLFAWPVNPLPLSVSFGVSIILAAAGYSLITINLNALGALWSNTPQERTRIVGIREGLGLAGLTLAAILPPLVQGSYSPETSYLALFASFLALLLIGLFGVLNIFKHTPLEKKRNERESFSVIKILCGPDRLFFDICFLTYIAASLPAVLVMFFIKDYLGAAELTGAFLMLYFLSGAALMPFWTWLSGQIGKERAWLSSMILAGLTFIWAAALQPGDTIPFMLICVLSGMALGADLIFPASIMADRIAEKSAESQTAQHYSILSLMPKIALALCSGLAFIILDSAGFNPGQQNPQNALCALVSLYALLPCLIKFIAAVMLWNLYCHQGVNNGKHKRSLAYGTDDAAD